jgi:hypothetical protein
MNDSNLALLRAFPSTLQKDATSALSRLPENLHWQRLRGFSVCVLGEEISIPNRVYHDVSKLATIGLNAAQREIICCLMSRHGDGFIRQKNLERIICSQNAWIPPFVIQLAGEYVLEILTVIEKNLGSFDRSIYSEFIAANRDFLGLTAQRIESYWDCYHRRIKKDEYVGFRILRYFESLDPAGSFGLRRQRVSIQKLP